MGETYVKGGDERRVDTSEEKVERREKEGKERKIRSNETGEKT